MKLRALLLACALAACSAGEGAKSDVAPQNVPIADQWRDAVITTRGVDIDPAHPGERQIGRLVFKGGVEITADVPEVGGLSGLYVSADGRFLAVSDHASWIEAKLISAPNGAPVRFEDARVAGLRDENAERFYETGLGDAEGLTRLPDGRFAVSFERTQLIRYYDLDRRGPFAPSMPGPRLAGAERLPGNAGLEALAYDGEAALIAGAERGGALGSEIWRAPLDAREPSPVIAHVSAPTGFGLVSLDRLSNGDFIALQRFYAPVVGVRIRVLKLNGAALRAGRIESELLAEFRPPLALDNFESVSAVPLPEGGDRLYMVSDNNFTPTQRTLLYVFDLAA